MPRPASLVCACLFTLAAVAPVVAQQRLFVRTGSEFVELDPRLPSLGTVIRRFNVPDAPAPNANVVTLAGGRYFAWGAGALGLFDTSSGAVQTYNFPGFSPYDVIGTDGDTRILVFGRGPGANNVVLVADIETGGVRFIDVGPASVVTSAAYAPESNVLFAARRATPGPLTAFAAVDVIDVASGTLIKTLDLSSAYGNDPRPWGQTIVTNALGSRLFIGLTNSTTVAVDVLTGQVVATNAALPLRSATLDEQRNRFFLNAGEGLLESFDADSLALLGTATVPLIARAPSQYGPYRAEDTVASGVSATILRVELALSPCEAAVSAIHADTGALMRTVNVTGALSCAPKEIDVLRVTEPAPPRGLAVAVAGSDVTLTWRSPFGATDYLVEAGSASGVADIATIRTSSAGLSLANVPPGTYYVRVRAANSIGTSGTSQEVRVVVP